MKKFTKKTALFLILILALSCFAACGGTESSDKASDQAQVQIPEEVQAVKDKVTSIAEKYAKQLDGSWGDRHAALVESEKGESYKDLDFEAMKSVLDGYREESGAYYIYALYPKDLSKTDSEPFIITVDGSEDPDEYGVEYEWEIQFQEAWSGTPAAARSAWADDEEGKDLCWSAFAPIHDSDGNIVAILGVDYPCPEILDYPEWNRDSDSWNGITE